MLGAAGMSKETDNIRPSHLIALHNYPLLVTLGLSLFLLISKNTSFMSPRRLS
jgi:hypothetical protein